MPKNEKGRWLVLTEMDFWDIITSCVMLFGFISEKFIYNKEKGEGNRMTLRAIVARFGHGSPQHILAHAQSIRKRRRGRRISMIYQGESRPMKAYMDALYDMLHPFPGWGESMENYLEKMIWNANFLGFPITGYWPMCGEFQVVPGMFLDNAKYALAHKMDRDPRLGEHIDSYLERMLFVANTICDDVDCNWHTGYHEFTLKPGMSMEEACEAYEASREKKGSTEPASGAVLVGA